MNEENRKRDIKNNRRKQTNKSLKTNSKRKPVEKTKQNISKKSVTKRSYDELNRENVVIFADSQREEAVNKKNKKYVSKKRIRRRNRILVAVSLTLILLTVITVLSLTVLFPIKTININNNKKYTDEQILSSIGIIKGDNLLLASESRANESVIMNYPYIKSIELDKKLPFELNVNVSEYSVYAQIKYGGDYLRISEDGKILELSKDFVKGVPVVTGVETEVNTVGEIIAFKNDSENETILVKTQKIINAFGTGKLGKVTLINFKNMQDIRVTYKNKIVMLLGSSSNLEKKLSHAKATLEARGNSKETGTLNLSRIPGTKNEASFIPRELENDEIAGK